MIGKSKLNMERLPNELYVDNHKITDKTEIAETLNNFFVNIGPDLASTFKPSHFNFEDHLKDDNILLQESNLTNDEFKQAFNSIKKGKNPGYDDISNDTIKPVFDNISLPLKHSFSLSLKRGIFPDKLKLDKVTLIFKSGEKSNLSNYRPILLTNQVETTPKIRQSTKLFFVYSIFL